MPGLREEVLMPVSLRSGLRKAITPVATQHGLLEYNEREGSSAKMASNTPR